MQQFVEKLAGTLVLGSLLDLMRIRHGKYEMLAHWTQGEFHHDVVLRANDTVFVVATNCNGGVKEVIAFPGDSPPERWALWHWRCPNVADFAGELPPILARATTTHYFDPCDLLSDDARSELLPEARVRQHGGGWEIKKCGV